MTKRYFSRIALKKEAHVQAIAKLLLPKPDGKNDGDVLAARHSLVWSLFAKDTQQKRNFLWREDRHGLFFTLSEHKPESDLFDIDVQAFEPDLKEGDKLAFVLRVNPVINKKDGDKRTKKDGTVVLRRRKVDVVMDQLQPYAKEVRIKGKPYQRGERRDMRDKLIVEAGTDWLEKQGSRYGFALQSCCVDSYFQHKLSRKNKNQDNRMCFSSLDYAGVLQVSDTSSFLKRLDDGFGSAKGFGCGLMMIKRI